MHSKEIRHAAVLALAGPLLAQVDIGLTPMLVEFPAVGGKPFSGSLVLKNGGTVKTRVRAELLDFYMDENTTPQFVANALRPFPNVAWLELPLNTIFPALPFIGSGASRFVLLKKLKDPIEQPHRRSASVHGGRPPRSCRSDQCGHH